jgi:hypothetical protein
MQQAAATMVAATAVGRGGLKVRVGDRVARRAVSLVLVGTPPPPPSPQPPPSLVGASFIERREICRFRLSMRCRLIITHLGTSKISLSLSSISLSRYFLSCARVERVLVLKSRLDKRTHLWKVARYRRASWGYLEFFSVDLFVVNFIIVALVAVASPREQRDRKESTKDKMNIAGLWMWLARAHSHVRVSAFKAPRPNKEWMIQKLHCRAGGRAATQSTRFFTIVTTHHSHQGASKKRTTTQKYGSHKSLLDTHHTQSQCDVKLIV